jgi:hypothetical protein
MFLVPELQRRNVIRVATAYVVAAWLIIQIAETTFPVFGFSDNAIRVVIIVWGIGLIPAIVGAWVFQLTPEAAQRLVLNPPFAVLYNDSRWNAWLDSIDMSAERLDAIEFDPNLPE